MPDSLTLRKILLNWRTWLVGFLGLVAVEVGRNYDKYRVTIPLMWEDARGWLAKQAQAATPAPTLPVPTPVPAPAPKKAEAPKPAVPCIASAQRLVGMIKEGGGDKYARQFEFFKNAETCFVLRMTAVGNLRMEFATKTWFNLSPTFYVTPKNRADLEKYRPGDLLKIRGRLARYVDTTGNAPDEIYIEGATFTRMDSDEMETGSIRR